MSYPEVSFLWHVTFAWHSYSSMCLLSTAKIIYKWLQDLLANKTGLLHSQRAEMVSQISRDRQRGKHAWSCTQGLHPGPRGVWQQLVRAQDWGSRSMAGWWPQCCWAVGEPLVLQWLLPQQKGSQRVLVLALGCHGLGVQSGASFQLGFCFWIGLTLFSLCQTWLPF